jgi:hypothetical protein
VTETRKSHRAPAGLSPVAKKLWKAVTEGLRMRPDELATLDAACRTADQIAALEAVVAASPPMIPGSKAQEVLHPAIPELRLQRQLLSQLLGRLDVPEAGDGDGFAGEWDNLTSSQRARKAALARWHAA